ncbi:MAG TPA: FecR domain-containing protein [Rhizomicrobium sp.]
MTEKPGEPVLQLIEEEAADWFGRRHFWAWSDADEVKLNAWLAESPAHEIAYWRLEAGWTRGERMAALRPLVPEKAVLGKGRGAMAVAARVAASLLIIGVVGIGVRAYMSWSQEEIYRTSLGEHRVVLLGDGSTIELNTSSVLRVTQNAGQRVAILEKGEAFFEVKHDVVHPFIVIAAGHRVTDLGTKFLLRLDNGRLTMALTEGRARLETENSHLRQSVLLTPGDTAIATSASLSMLKRPAQNLSAVLSWRRGLLIFDRTTVADAAAEFNRYNSEKLVVADAVAGQQTITGTFQTGNTSDFTSLARDVLGLHVQRLGSEIVISR